LFKNYFRLFIHRIVHEDHRMFISKRTAIDSSGRIGYFYDACRDEIVFPLESSLQIHPEKIQETRKCELIHCRREKYPNLLKTIDIDDASRLGLLLNLKEKKGIGRVLDYNLDKNKYTRILRYTYIKSTQKLSNDPRDVKKLIMQPKKERKATHFITQIDFGIDVAVILQLPIDENDRGVIDDVLNHIRDILLHDGDISSLTSKDIGILNKILNTKVYSNTNEISQYMSLLNVCKYIQRNKNISEHQPIVYYLRSINWLYPDYAAKDIKFTPLDEKFSNNIEDHIIRATGDIDRFTKDVKEELPKLTRQNLKNHMTEAQKQLCRLKQIFGEEIQQLMKLVVEVRSGHLPISSIKEIMDGKEPNTTKYASENLRCLIEDIKRKGDFINGLESEGFRYINVTDYNISSTDNRRSIERLLITDVEFDRILCSNDTLCKDYLLHFNQYKTQMIEERKYNPHLCLSYADFTYCPYNLQYILRLPLSIYETENNLSSKAFKPQIQSTQTQTTNRQDRHDISQTTSLSHNHSSKETDNSVKRPVSFPDDTSKRSKKSETKREQHSEDKSINIVLFGETGVGKSTFINAFANYLKFDTLKQAEKGTPIVLIPVSFLITTGDNFDEHTVNFGNADKSNNENFEHPGQSVTQQCRSYEFTVKQKIRIIDTPGFGDTRGIEQDERNMKHITEYLKTLKNIDIICFLLKPDVARLNMFFRTCILQLFSLFGSNIGDRMVFCFTNSRSTFYAPGNTGPLLREMLSTLPNNTVSFKKENAFCFDNESFRYLVALQNGISFSELDRKEYEKSWSTSVVQSKRFIDYIMLKTPQKHNQQ